MKKLSYLILFLCSALLSNAQGYFQPFIDSLAKAYLQNHAGALVIGIHDNGKEKIYYFGETTQGNRQKPDSNSIFEIGGITETFTAVLFAHMHVKGIIQMDEKLQDFLPVIVPAPVYQKIICQKAEETSQLKQMGDHENVRVNFTPYVCFPDPSSKPQQIILCDLATHTTGLPQYPNNLDIKKNKNNPFATYTKENLYDFIKEYRFDKPLGYDYNHSDVGIALLGHALSLKAKTDFETLIVDKILNPLKMTNTIIDASLKKQHLVTGHDKSGKTVPNWGYDIMAPVGGLHSSISDMMKFLAANVSLQKDYFSDILDYSHNPRLKLNGKKKGTEIALGWKINSLGTNEKRVVWQEGITGGYSSYIGFVETSHTGVVILSSVSKNVNSIGIEILKRLAHQKL